MSRDKNFSGQPVFAQLIRLLDKDRIIEISRNTPGSEVYVKKLDGYIHLIIMLFAVFNHFDSLREIEVGLQAQANKLAHLGINYLVRRSTLSDANKRRPEEFFAQVYADLYAKYRHILADSYLDSRGKSNCKNLYLLDSTTIKLFSNLLKGVGRTPKNGKRKGGLKRHSLEEYSQGDPL